MCKVKQLQRQGHRPRGPRAPSCQCRVLCPRRAQFLSHVPRTETLVFSAPDQRDSSPLSALPQNLADRFRARRVDKKAAQLHEQEADEQDASDGPGQTPLPPGYEAGSSLDKLWEVGDNKRAKHAPSSTELSRANAADADLMKKLTHERPCGGEEGSSSTGRPQSTPRSFMESLQGTSPMRTAASTLIGLPRKASERTADEQIRVSRQSRMREQGLTGGSQQGAWRSQDRSAEVVTAGRKDIDVRPEGSAELSRLLGEQAGYNEEGHDGEALSAEQFTLKKEQKVRSQGVEVISTECDYQPAVNTWGVYDRPRDISAAFGGGRRLTPEDSVMSTEEQAEYDRQLNQKLQQFRRASGLVIDPEKARECEHLTAKGTALLDGGRLQSALLLFEEAAALVSVKSDIGGKAALQRAITLDSLGFHAEALKLYRQLRTHRCTSIAKSARSMSFGFQAGEYLKADTISYAAKKEELDPYFTVLAGKWGWDTVYSPSAEEKATSAANNTLLFAVSSVLVIAPLAWVLFAYILC